MKSGLETDWLYFRQLRNKFTSLVRNRKAEFYLSMTTECLKNRKKFWKAIKYLSSTFNSVNLPPSMLSDGSRVTNKTEILNCFNRHFISSGFLFKSKKPSNQPLSSEKSSNGSPLVDRAPVQAFNFPFSTAEVC